MKIKVVCVFLMCATGVRAQNFQDWFRQKSTQKKYLLEQIAALQLYGDYIKQGVEIEGKGLTTIHQIKNGDFNLHFDFFTRLQKANPEIKNAAQVVDMIALQMRMLQQVKKTTSEIKKQDAFTDEELSYCENIFDNVVAESLKNVDELLSIITDGEYAMTDDGRIERMDKIYAGMQDLFSFVVAMARDMVVLAGQRGGEQAEVEAGRRIISRK